MKISQLSVFLENRPGQLSIPCKALSDTGINIVTLSLADTHQFGVLRLIVRDGEKARQVLKDAGCVVNVTEVVAIEVADEPGGLARVLAVIEDRDINLEYMYVHTYRAQENAVLIFRFEQPDSAIEALQAAGIRPLSDVDLFERAGR